MTNSTDTLSGQALAVVAMTVVYSIIFVVAFLGNVLVIYVVASRSYMKTTFNFLIVNMAIADLLVSVLIMPIQVSQTVCYATDKKAECAHFESLVRRETKTSHLSRNIAVE